MSEKIILIKCDVKDYIPIGNFTPLQGELKNKTDKDLRKLKELIIQNGFIFPLFVAKVKKQNFTMDGHGRDIISIQLKEEGYKFKRLDGKIGDQLPVVYIKAKDRKEAKEQLLYLNSRYGKITEKGLFGFINEPNLKLDFEKMKIHLDLPELSLDKFSQKYYSKDDEKLNELPKISKKAISKTGDLFVLNSKHRILCGDSTKKKDVELLMDGKKPDLILTDPPYGINYHISKTGLPNKSNFDEMKNDKGNLDLTLLFNVQSTMKILFGANNYPNILPHRGRWICWDKRSKDDYDERPIDSAIGSKFELAWVDKKSGYDDLYRVQHVRFVNSDRAEQKKRFHPTQKPVRLFMLILQDYEKSKLILDLFIGSGTTLIASTQKNRICYGMEIDPIYIDVILRRYHNLYPDHKIECLNRKFDFDKLFRKIK